MAEQLAEGTLGGVKIRLATWLPPEQRFTDGYVPVRPGLQFLPNDPTSLVSRRYTPYWKVDDWEAGEGFDTWEPEIPGFNKSDAVTIKRVGKGLVLGPFIETTQKTGPVDMDESGVLGYGEGSIFTIAASNQLHKWNRSTGIWEQYNSNAAPASTPSSIADPGDGWIYVGFADGTIRRYDNGSSVQTHYTGFTNAPVLTVYEDKLYALDGDDLYDVDLVTTNTRTLKADIIGNSSEYLSETPAAYRRLTSDAIGPLWLQRLNSGLCLIWRYNVNDDFYEAIGELPVQMALPTSIYSALGFTFVGFRVAATSGEEGNGHIYFQRGGQRGVTDPIRTAGTSANREVTIGGLDGDDLLFTYDDQVWAFQISDGGLFHLGPVLEDGGGGNPWALCLGQSLFTSPVAFQGGPSLGCQRADRGRYTTVASRTHDSGMYDATFFDTPKRLHEVEVITEPLPTNTSIGLAYALDGDTSFTIVTPPASASAAGAKSHKFDISTVGSTIIGRRFEFRFLLTTTDNTVTPTIRSWTARFSAAAHERVITMALDFSDDDDGEQRTHKLISDIRALIDAQALVNLVMPWQKKDGEVGETVVVQVDEVSFPDAIQSPGQLVGVVRCFAKDLVT